MYDYHYDSSRLITVEVWGDFACFTAPYGKVERLTYPFPTPSAVRGILSAIYMKPIEFYWQVRRIEVLNPIQYISFKRNELECAVSGKEPVFADEVRTQRQTVALRDVHYRIAATVEPRSEALRKKQDRNVNMTAIYEQAVRRIRTGKTYHQPGLGMREFVGYFEEARSDGKPPIDESIDAGFMVYDIFDFPRDMEVKKKPTPRLTLFHAVMDHGVIQVPPYDSPEVLKVNEMAGGGV